MKRPSPAPLRCHASIFPNTACRAFAAPGHPYCATHQFLLDPGGSALTSLSLLEEVRLARLQVHRLVSQAAPPAQVLDALRTLALVARLQERLQRPRHTRR